MASRRTIRRAVAIGAGSAALALTPAGIASAEPQWTDTQVHGGANGEVRESGYNHRDSIHDMTPYHSQGTWCCLTEIRESFKAIPQTAGG